MLALALAWALKWRVVGYHCTEVVLPIVVCRYFYERNQTVRFGMPSHDDAGRYKCVGYGHDPSDVISYVNKLVVGGLC